MKFSPHAYQKQAIDFIVSHPEAAIFLECGLGKTVITLSAILELMFDRFLVKKVLVVAPLRVAKDTWPTELQKWSDLSLLSARVLTGSKAQREKTLRVDADITVVNRENLAWLIQTEAFSYDMVVIDELSSFKHREAKRFKALLKVRPKIRRIVGLTGTPASNGLMDLWAEFRLLDQGERLGRYITGYRDRWFLPDKQNRYQVFSYKPRSYAEDDIYSRIRDITLSMKTSDYLKLPPLSLLTHELLLSPKARKLYKKLKDELILNLDGSIIDAVNAASLSGKLLQLSSGALYQETGQALHIHNVKLDALEDLIEAQNGKTCLVAYWFRHDLERIMDRFPEARTLKSSKDISDWNEGNIQIGLIHPASAGHGLNLQHGGSTLIWFSLTWSLELYQQTNARLYRQGQEKSVFIHHLVVKDTIEERVMQALKDKDETQASLIEAVKAELERRM